MDSTAGSSKGFGGASPRSTGGFRTKLDLCQGAPVLDAVIEEVFVGEAAPAGQEEPAEGLRQTQQTSMSQNTTRSRQSWYRSRHGSGQDSLKIPESLDASS